eukprot:351176_1
MLELSMTLPIKVQNGGLFISRGVGRHPARRLESWEIIFVEKGRLTIQEEERIFLVDAGESLLLWPNRQHVGVEDFPPPYGSCMHQKRCELDQKQKIFHSTGVFILR